MKWSIRKRFQKGELVNWRFMYGYRICKGRVEIHEQEAEVVRWVYEQYLGGKAVVMIAQTLRERDIPLPFGGEWTPNRIIQLLKNEKYAGNALLQKAYVADHISKQEKLNHGQLPRYFVEGSHECCPYVNTMNPLEKPAFSAFLGIMALHTPPGFGCSNGNNCRLFFFSAAGNTPRRIYNNMKSGFLLA